MSMMNAARCWLFVQLSGACAFKHEATAPMRKVVELLKNVEADVAAEGEKEAAEFKAYTKFCAKSSDEKDYQIGRSQKEISRMKAQIGMLTQDISSLAEELKTLTKDAAAFKEQLESAVATRAGEASNYSAKAKSMTESIIALEKALQAVKEGKGTSAGLAQVTAMASKVLSSTGKLNLLQLGSAQGGDEVTETLRDLKNEFIKNKHDLDMEEQNAKFAFGKIQVDMTNRLKFAKEDMDEKTGTKTAKEVEKAQLDKDLAAESTSLRSDESFLKELKKTCADKVEAAEERKTMRAGELEALGKAIGQLTKDASMLQANADMPIRNHLQSQLQASSFPTQDETAKMAAVRSVEPASASASGSSFLQRRTMAPDLDSKMAKLEAMSTKLNVPLFSLAFLKVKAANATDPYASIRGVIKNLVSDLENSTSNAASVKAQCDKIEGANKKDMAESQKQIDELTAEIDGTEAFLAKESKGAAELEKDITELKETLAEAEKLRASEKKGNEEAVKEAKAGELAASNAKDTLEAYYKATPGFFLQVSQPKVTTADYKGETTQRSSGVLGLLDVVISDFQSAKTKTEAEETKAASDYEAFKTKSKSDVSSKKTELKSKKEAISEARVKLLDSKGSLDNQEEINKKAKQALEESKAMCAPESFAARKEARDQNIASLKSILVELEDMIAAEASR